MKNVTPKCSECKQPCAYIDRQDGRCITCGKRHDLAQAIASTAARLSGDLLAWFLNQPAKAD